jgi:hypothetical protein
MTAEDRMIEPTCPVLVMVNTSVGVLPSFTDPKARVLLSTVS